jgi:hypothetical protein
VYGLSSDSCTTERNMNSFELDPPMMVMANNNKVMAVCNTDSCLATGNQTNGMTELSITDAETWSINPTTVEGTEQQQQESSSASPPATTNNLGVMTLAVMRQCGKCECKQLSVSATNRKKEKSKWNEHSKSGGVDSVCQNTRLSPQNSAKVP